MPIDTKYDGYDLAVSKSTKVRDFADGEFTVKAKEDAYLPKLGGQNNVDYKAYLMRGYVIPAVEPTALAISGAIMRRLPMFEPIGKLAYLLDDFDGMRTSANKFIEGMIKEQLYAGVGGYLVEFIDNKAVVKQYARESIINVSDTYIVLTQEYTVQDERDKYKQETKLECLELTFDEAGHYIQNVWREDKGKWAIVDTKTPDIRGDSFTELPFVFAGELTNDPVLLHLANINHKQYMQSTDESHGLHWTALPTLFLFGDLRDSEGNKKQLKIGAGSANHIEDETAKAELLEFTGAGLGALKASIDSKVQDMASVGAKMLASGSDNVKAAETARIEASSETATLSTLANTIDSTVERLLEIVARWMGQSVPEFKVNRDFVDIKIDPADMLANLQTMQGGGMSLDTFVNLLFKGEKLPPGVTVEEEIAKIESGSQDFDLEKEVPNEKV